MPAGRRVALAYPVAATCLLALLFVWQRGTYPNYAEGVYLFSSNLILDGAVPYRDFAAAHPPLLFYSGAGFLALWDSIDAIRVLLSGLSLVTGGLVAAAVFRLTASAPGAVLAGLAAIVAPWSLHEHALHTPETFGAPLLMGAALLAARRRTAVWAGLLAAVAVGFKWPFLFWGLALALATPAKVPYLAALTGGFAAGVLLSFVLFGAGPLYDALVVAQQDVGWYGLREVGAYTAQGVWNLAPLLVPAAVAVAFARRALDVPLLRSLVVAAVAALVLVATITKTGTYLNTIVLAEPPLVALAGAGIVWLAREARPRWAVEAVAVAVALGAAQVTAFVARPDDPRVFLRPFSALGHTWTSASAVDALLAAVRDCPPQVAYSGPPYVAFLADRRMPGDEPDQFLMARTPVAAPSAAQAAQETIRCP